MQEFDLMKCTVFPRITAFVGGGGKSTLIYHLAQMLSAQGKRVLVTTSTHIWYPKAEYFAASEEAVKRIWKDQRFAVIGTFDPQTGKLSQPEKGFLHQILSQADHVLVEADGSKGCPVKYPREWEPVIWPETQLVVAVMGLSALGQPLRSCCFGFEQAAEQLHADPAHILTPADAAALLLSGGRKAVEDREFWVVLNQCDDDDRKSGARRIAAMLEENGVRTVLTASFDAQVRIHYNMLAKASDKEDSP